MRSLAVFLVFLFFATGCNVGMNAFSSMHNKKAKYQHDKGIIKKYRLISVESYEIIKEEHSLPIEIDNIHYRYWSEYWEAYRKGKEPTSSEVTVSHGFLLRNVVIINNGGKQLIPNIYLRHAYRQPYLSELPEGIVNTLMNTPGWPSKVQDTGIGRYHFLHYIFLNNKKEKLSNFTLVDNHEGIEVIIGTYQNIRVAKWAYDRETCKPEEFREQPIRTGGFLVGNGLVNNVEVSNGYSGCEKPEGMEFFDWLDEYHGD